MSRIIAKLIISFFLFLLIWVDSSGQTYTRRNSPYSRYGMGDLFSLRFSATQSFAGGLDATYTSPFDLNLSNPASLGSLRFTSFQVGVFYQHDNYTENSTGLKAQANDGNLNYLSLAFPITRSWEVEKIRFDVVCRSNGVWELASYLIVQ